MKRVAFFLIPALFIVISSCDKHAADADLQEELELKKGRKILTFSANLSGSEEVPPVTTDASGQASFKLNKEGDVLSYKLIVEELENVTAAHIHLAQAGQNGPVVLWLYPASSPGQLIPGYTSGILNQGDATSANLSGELAGMDLSELIDRMIAGTAYVNVHTSANTGGEIRGQISLNGNIKD